MDHEHHPVNLTIERQEGYSRWLALATLLFAIPKAIFLIPHFIILYILAIVLFFLVIIAQFIVLITGDYPEGIHKIVLGILQWQVRVTAYFAGLTDRYPPFRLS